MMDITVKVIKELEDGGAICTLDMDKEAVQYLIGEGFLAVLKRALDSSESHIKPKILDEALKETEGKDD
jgi:hypothetical protein